ncbi:unnamed protein product [Blepharisma stoltei]|uniref:Response regulatory domain-containing protein n=1 Tax=Blepharisma stoltei TaxID=1481888 RepID=A0AAU9JFD0_9CILI|nr:unnamed protein product [Blepharisma stoltei]
MKNKSFLCKKNLYLKSRKFTQAWHLAFKDFSSESKYLYEIGMQQKFSMNVISCWAVIGLSLGLLCGHMDFISYIYFITGLAPFLPFIRFNNYFQRILTEFFCFYFLRTYIGQSSISECLGAQFPSFVLNLYLLKKWSYSSIIFGAEYLLICIINNIYPAGLILSSITYTIFIACLEKQLRDLWRIYTAFKKSEGSYFELFQSSPHPIFILQSGGKIIFHNKSAMKLLEIYSNKSKEFDDNFESFFGDDDKPYIRNLIQTGLSGEYCVDEFIIQDIKRPDPLHSLGLLISAEHISWQSENCVKIICVDISSYAISRQQIINNCQTLEAAFERMAFTAAMIYQSKTSLNRGTLTTINSLHNSLKNNLLIQQYLSSRISAQRTNFDLNIEIQNSIELAYLQASEKEISLTYTRDQGLPNCVNGYRSFHNQLVYTMLSYIISHSEDHSNIYLLIEVATAVQKDITVNYKFTFRSSKIADDELNYLFQKSISQRKQFSDFILSIKEFGSGMAIFESMLHILKGSITETTISDTEIGKCIISFRLPFTTIERESPTKLLRLSTSGSITETPLTVKWRPNIKYEHDMLSRYPVDETVILKEQIQTIKNKKKKEVFQIQIINQIGANLIEERFMPRISISRVRTPTQSLSSDEEISSGSEDWEDNENAINIDCKCNSCEILSNGSQILSDYIIHSSSLSRKYYRLKAKKTEILRSRKVKFSSKNNHFPIIIDRDIFSVKKFLFHEGRKESLCFDVGINSVLVVDDDEQQREILENFIKNMKWSVDFARDGYGAIKMFESYASQGFVYKVIFMDIIMPKLDGLKATQKIREIEAKFHYPRTFICGLSGDKDARQKAEAAGMDNFLMKPTAYRTIKELLDSRQKGSGSSLT